MATIEPTDELYRRLAPTQVNPDGTANSSAFKRGKAYETEISVDLAKLTDPVESVNRAPKAGFSLGVFRLQHALDENFSVVWSPLEETETQEANNSHTLLTGENDQDRSRRLARNVRAIPDLTSVGRA